MKRLLLFTIITIKSLALTVYDPANHQTNMQIYQTNILQKIEQIRTATEAVQQTIYQAQNVKDNATNLESWAGFLLGDQSTQILKAMDDLNAINNNSRAILRSATKIDSDFDKFYLTSDDIKNLTYDDIYNSISRVENNRRYALKDNLKTATTVLEQNAKDRQSIAGYMTSTDGSKGALQANLATKKGIDQLNNKLNRSLDLQAKQLMIESQKEAEEALMKQLEEERIKRLVAMSEQTERKADKYIKNKKLW